MTALPTVLPDQWSRALILAVRPNVDEGRFPFKRVTGEHVWVSADIVADGHDTVAAEVLYGQEGGEIRSVRLRAVGNDVYEGSFTVGNIGPWSYRVRAWVNTFATWQAIFRRRVDARSDIAELKSELLEGAVLLRKTLENASGDDKDRLQTYIERFEAGDSEAALEEAVAILAATYDSREGAAESERLNILVERPLAQFSSWYAFFPRSLGKDGAHGTLDDAAEHLDYVKEMGFDVAYLLPIHPIGTSFRKGKDNAPVAQEGDPVRGVPDRTLPDRGGRVLPAQLLA